MVAAGGMYLDTDVFNEDIWVTISSYGRRSDKDKTE